MALGSEGGGMCSIGGEWCWGVVWYVDERVLRGIARGCIVECGGDSCGVGLGLDSMEGGEGDLRAGGG